MARSGSTQASARAHRKPYYWIFLDFLQLGEMQLSPATASAAGFAGHPVFPALPCESNVTVCLALLPFACYKASPQF